MPVCVSLCVFPKFKGGINLNFYGFWSFSKQAEANTQYDNTWSYSLLTITWSYQSKLNLCAPSISSLLVAISQAMICSPKHGRPYSSMVLECLLSYSHLRETVSPEKAQDNTCLLGIHLQPGLEGILFTKVRCIYAFQRQSLWETNASQHTKSGEILSHFRNPI